MIPFYILIDIDYKIKNNIPLSTDEVEILYQEVKGEENLRRRIRELEEELEDAHYDRQLADDHYDCVSRDEYNDLKVESNEVLNGMWEIIELFSNPFRF